MIENVLRDGINDLTNYLENPLFKDSYTSAEKAEVRRVRTELKKLEKTLSANPKRSKAVGPSPNSEGE